MNLKKLGFFSIFSFTIHMTNLTDIIVSNHINHEERINVVLKSEKEFVVTEAQTHGLCMAQCTDVLSQV